MKSKATIGVLAAENRLSCSHCGHEHFQDIGEYPYSWQTALCPSCTSILTVHEDDYKSLVAYRDGTTEWIRNYDVNAIP